MPMIRALAFLKLLTGLVLLVYQRTSEKWFLYIQILDLGGALK